MIWNEMCGLRVNLFVFINFTSINCWRQLIEKWIWFQTTVIITLFQYIHSIPFKEMKWNESLQQWKELNCWLMSGIHFNWMRMGYSCRYVFFHSSIKVIHIISFNHHSFRKRTKWVEREKRIEWLIEIKHSKAINEFQWVIDCEWSANAASESIIQSWNETCGSKQIIPFVPLMNEMNDGKEWMFALLAAAGVALIHLIRSLHSLFK